MSRVKYQYELDKLQVEEKYMISIANHLEDQINRLKVEEMALKSQLYIQENPYSSERESESQKADDDVNINELPLNLGVHMLHDDEEDEDEDDEDDDDTAEVTQLSNFLDQLAQQHHQQQLQMEEEEDEEDEEDEDEEEEKEEEDYYDYDEDDS